MNNYIVYKATAPSGSCYIGITYRSLNKRKWEHYNRATKGTTKTPIAKAIQKYGESIRWEVLISGLSKQEAKAKEIFYISELKKLGIKLYNVTLGGDIPWNSGKTGFKWSKESILKRTQSRTGYKHSEQTKNKMSKARKGYKPSNSEINKRIRAMGNCEFQVFSKDGACLGTWLNKSQCARELNLLASKIALCLAGKRKTHKGYTFKVINNT